MESIVTCRRKTLGFFTNKVESYFNRASPSTLGSNKRTDLGGGGIRIPI
ncbi:hypothetical protein Cabys_2979 [Caldithrix abyssi DSM 13497]|uniref:Uncharacterized protein n=1 Tax=Caldithrix abyssi DSM 13497 TaxID=880073 RepID=A0A1J1CAM6_CALAY|nr:hypothetical protein Cabys_2979 [Caldithrix abyssi DSM 13497]